MSVNTMEEFMISEMRLGTLKGLVPIVVTISGRGTGDLQLSSVFKNRSALTG